MVGEEVSEADRDLVRGLGGDAVLSFLGRRNPEVSEAEVEAKRKVGTNSEE